MPTLEDEQTAGDNQLEDLEQPFAAPSATGSGSPKTTNAPTTDDENDAADDTVGNGYQNSSKEIKVNKGWWNKRKAKVAGGIAGAGAVGGLLGITFLAGPLEFIHLAENLHDSHISQQEQASDGRLGKMFRYFRSNLDAGETRLGFVGSKYKTRILAQLKEIGLEPKFNRVTGYFESMTIDTTSDKSPYRGLSQEEAIRAIETDYGGTARIDKEGKFNVTDIGTKYFAQRKALRTSVVAMGDSRLSTAARMRVLKKYGMVTWHPLAALDKKINASAAEVIKDKYSKYKEKWDNRIKSGSEPLTIDGSKAQDPSKDQNGNHNPVSAADQEEISGGSSKAAETLKGLKTTGKLAGGVAAAAGLACALKGVDDKIADIKYSQVILPMIRVGLDAMSVASQIMSGQDVDPDELAYLSRYLSSTDSITGKTSSATDAKPLRANAGESGGTDINDGIRGSLTQEKPAWLDWTQTPVVGGLCSTTGTIITGIVGGVVGVLSGGVISTVSGFIVSSFAAGPIIDYTAGLLSGDALNLDTLAGAQFGAVADYGAALGANAADLGMGAVQLTAAQVGQLNADTQQTQKSEFASQSFFARTFDLYDYRSLASITLSGQTNSFTHNLASATQSITGTLSTALSTPLKLYGNTTHAATAAYQYPFPIYGFSDQDLSSQAVADPYANADAAGRLLDNNGTGSTPDYIKKAMDCFGVEITKGSEGWDVIPNKDVNIYDTDNYHASDCADTGDADWLKIRFFILDTGTMEGYACAKFADSESCANNSGGDTSAVADTTTLPDTTNTDIQALAQQVLTNKNIHLGVYAKADITDTAAGKKVLPGEVSSSSYGSGSLGPCPNGRVPVDINANLLMEMLFIAQKYDYEIQDIVSGHPCDAAKHPLGRAFDIFQLKGKPIEGNCDTIDTKQFADYIASTLSTDVGPTGQGSIGTCGDGLLGSVPNNVGTFFDSSDQIHVSVWSP